MGESTLAPILVVDDEEQALIALKTALALEGYTNAVSCSRGSEVLQLTESRRPSLILLDMNMPDVSGYDLLPRLREQFPGIPVIIITAVDDVGTAVDSMKKGAFTYMVKPVDIKELKLQIRKALDFQEITAENERLNDIFLQKELSQPEAFSDIITRDPGMLSIFKYIEAVAPSSLPILITGETGTGKELIARSVHRSSGRPGLFVPVNIAGLEDTFFSDTLFGHQKGAFTGAESSRSGLIVKAAQGTLFLDEIGDLQPESQIKLLRLIQDKEYYPLGSDSPLSTDARFVFATNKNLEEQMAEGKFRNDLYYRLKSHRIHLPPLRDRKEDLPLLVNHFLHRAAEEFGRKVPAVSPEFYRTMSLYDFPGNIRELEGIVQDMVLQNRAGASPVRNLRTQLFPRKPETEQASGSAVTPFSGFSVLPSIKEADQLLIQEALRRSGGNKSQAAALLGMTRQALGNRLKSMKLSP
ncbi:MAG: sigma-54-dependent transcriptional regulator [Spirochaetia bacterium]